MIIVISCAKILTLSVDNTGDRANNSSVIDLHPAYIFLIFGFFLYNYFVFPTILFVHFPISKVLLVSFRSALGRKKIAMSQAKLSLCSQYSFFII